MEFADRVLKCVDCGVEFVFSAGEQEFFHEKQFRNDPKRCKKCRARRDPTRSNVRPEVRIKCAQCGLETTVPFNPTQGKAVLCRTCFQKSRHPIDAPSDLNSQ